MRSWISSCCGARGTSTAPMFPGLPSTTWCCRQPGCAWEIGSTAIAISQSNGSWRPATRRSALPAGRSRRGLGRCRRRHALAGVDRLYTLLDDLARLHPNMTDVLSALHLLDEVTLGFLDLHGLGGFHASFGRLSRLGRRR